MALRKNTVADALALIEINNGWKNFVQPHVHGLLYDYLELVSVEEAMKTGRMYRLTDTGQEIVTTSPLWAAHQRLLSMGYKRDTGSDYIRPRKASKRYIPYKRFNEETSRNDTAWISATRANPVIFISRPVKDGGVYKLEN